MRRKHKKLILKIITSLATLMAAFLVFALTLQIANADKLVLGLKMASIPVGGKTGKESQEILKYHIDEFLKEKIVLAFNNQLWQATAEELGIKINVEETLNNAYNIGHKKNALSSIIEQVKSLIGVYNLSVAYQIDNEGFEKFIFNNLHSLEEPARNATFVFENNDFVLIPSQKGKVMNREDIKRKLKKIVKNLKAEEISLALIEDLPEVEEHETDLACKKAKEILENLPYLVIVNGVNKEINKDKIISWLEFVPVPEGAELSDENNPENKILGVGLDEEKLKDYLTALSASINREPVNAVLTIRDGRAIKFALSRDGLKLEMEANIPILKNGILNGQKRIELLTIKTPPKITTESIDNSGITALLGKGVSDFSGSPANRIHNIKIGATKFNGVLIEPGKEFSFNATLEEVGPEQGYLPELVIKRDKTIPEYGGGLCQVSTTAFRAAINSGLEITQRLAHAFPVKYYNPQGFDATIYPPSVDLKFINDTPSYLLIQTKITGNQLTFEFYGTDDGREIKVDGPYQYDVKKDGSMKAVLYREIYKNGELITKNKFTSTYRSPALYPIERNPLE